MSSTGSRIARGVIVVLVAIVAAAVGYVVFVDIPSGSLARLLGVLITIVVALFGFKIARNYADSIVAPYTVGRVFVEGPIARRSGGMPTRPVLVTADDIVDQIEAANADDAVQALVVSLDTPGGEVVPSDDIRRAVEDFDGPTVAYATDTCASGGYWIASGCDHIVAREGSIVGSIGVIASRVTGEGLLDRLGLTYERLVAGEYKDAGLALREMDEDDREYLQGIVDDYYQTFIDRVTAGREIDEETVKETEARVFLGEAALERGLVDEVGAADTVEAWVDEAIDEKVVVRDFEPHVGIATRFRRGAERVAYALGAGISSVFVDNSVGGANFEFR